MDADVLIVGMGVVGLSCAAQIAKRGYNTLCIERHESFGQETSSRNSEVIHSGIYYPAGSLKAQMCVAGNRSMYAECDRLGVWYRRCGKFVVAVTAAEEGDLGRLFRQGCENGVEGLEMVEGGKARSLEANILCRAAMHVPSAGILDSHGLMKAYYREAADHGAALAFGVEFLEPVRQSNGFAVQVRDTSGEVVRISTRWIVNAAGLRSDRIAASFGIDPDAAGYRLYPNRGHYFRVSPSKSRLVSRLVYPIPPKGFSGLGIHITVDRAGQCKLGPDTEYIGPDVPEAEWYRFEERRREKFHAAVSRYLPALRPEDLSPDQVGVRPKLQKPGGPVRDFVVAEESGRGLAGLINLIGIESPGLTCAFEIGKEVARLIGEKE